MLRLFNSETAINNVNNYPTLASFLGIDWIRKIISVDQPKFHPLRYNLVVDDASCQVALKSLNKNLDIVLTALKQSNSDDKINNLRGNLKDMEKFPETVLEIEWFAKWISEGLPVIIEPNYPKSGPDAKVTVNGTDVYCEITMVNLSEAESKAVDIRGEVIHRVRKIKSGYLVRIGLTSELAHSDVNPMVELITKKLDELAKQGTDETTITYVSESKTKASIYFKKKFNPVATIVAFHWSGRGSELNHRIEDTILGKVKQLKKAPQGSSKIVILDLSRHLAADIYADWAMLGQEETKMYFDKVTGEFVGMEGVRAGGAFSVTNTVSAVITTQRIFNDKDWKLTGICCINPNADIPISEDILRTLTSE